MTTLTAEQAKGNTGISNRRTTKMSQIYESVSTALIFNTQLNQLLFFAY